MRIADKEIGPGQPVFLQAEVGVTHNGDLGRALALVDAAARAGLDACKFIVTDPDKIGGAAVPYGYESARGMMMAPIGALLAQTMLTFEQWQQIRDHCRARGILFYATADHVDAVAMLDRLEVPAHKTSSWDIAYGPLLAAMSKSQKPVLIEMGTASQEEMWAALDRVPGDQLLILAPHPHEAADWNFTRLKRRPWGFSSPGREAWCDFVALALGAVLIEKRLTLDRHDLQGHHHWISLDPGEMAAWVRQIRVAEAALREPPWVGSDAGWAERRKWDRDLRGFRQGDGSFSQ